MNSAQYDPMAVLATTLVNAVLKHLPSEQEKRGDRKLELARDLTTESGSLMDEVDRGVIEAKITQ